MPQDTTIALLSGGIDSATTAAIAKNCGHTVIGLSFNYGQRHQKELKAAAEIAINLQLDEHIVLNIDLGAWGGSSLTDFSQNIPTKGVQKGIIPNTYVPGRNTVFIAIGLSLAEARGANKIALGINAMDYSGYPDCRPEYLNAFQNLANLSNKAGIEGNAIKLWAPLIQWKKTEIIQEALRLKVPIERTWSCYSDNTQPCGKCDSCRIRNKALIEIDAMNLSNEKI